MPSADKPPPPPPYPPPTAATMSESVPRPTPAERSVDPAGRPSLGVYTSLPKSSPLDVCPSKSRRSKSRKRVSFRPRSFHIACGIGGETLGFQRANYNVCGLWDICPANAAVLKRRWPDAELIVGDIHDDSLMRRVPEGIHVVTVSLQCQGSSTANKKRGIHDTRHDTGVRMVTVALAIDPHAIVIETVKGFTDKKLRPRYNQIMRMLHDAGYNVHCHIINSSAWTASSRPRLFITATRSDEDLVAGVADFAKSAPAVPISTITHAASMFAAVRPSGMGPSGQQCIFSRNERYPCCTTNCLRRPPKNYDFHPRDCPTGFKNCLIPGPRDILQVLGFPRDYLTKAELSAPRCICPVCNGHRASQVGRQLGRVWCPAVAEQIADALRAYVLRRIDTCRDDVCNLNLPAPDDDIDDFAEGHIADGLCHRHAQRRFMSDPLYEGDDCASALLSESTLLQYVKAAESKTGLDIRTVSAPELYSLDDVKIGEHATPASRKRIKAMLKKYADVFAKSDEDLPKPVLDDDGQPVQIRLQFKDDYKPTKCKAPSARPGSARYKILEAFRIEFEKKGLLVRRYRSRWANRPHLVAKYLSTDERQGVPSSIRFTCDMSIANTQCDLLAPVHGDVASELQRTAGHQWYCSADAMKSYWSFLYDEESSEACTMWLPCEGKWRLYRFTRMQMGALNSATHMQNFYYHIAQQHLDADTHSTLADDWVFWDSDGTQQSALDNFEAFLAMCLIRQVTIKPSKCELLTRKVSYYGWLLDADGISPAKRNLDPIRRMRAPRNISELKSVLGTFVQFRHFLMDTELDNNGNVRSILYNELVGPISESHVNGISKDFSQAWGPLQTAAFERIRHLLLKGVHLSTPLSDRSMHMAGDMSEFGFSVFLFQMNDDGTKRYIMLWNKPWGITDRDKPPPHKEAKCWAVGFQWCLPMVQCHGHPFLTFTDSMPVSWMRKGRGRSAFSHYILADFDSVEWAVYYLEGPRNVLADSMSRPPMLGELAPAQEGIIFMLDKALELIPSDLKQTIRNVYVHADSDTDRILRHIRGWRPSQGKTFSGGPPTYCPSFRKNGYVPQNKPIPHLLIAFPEVVNGPAMCADFIRSGVPFICMVESTLLDHIGRVQAADGDYSTDHTVVHDFAATSRLMFSHAGYTVVVGGFDHERYQHQFLVLPAPCDPLPDTSPPSPPLFSAQCFACHYDTDTFELQSTIRRPDSHDDYDFLPYVAFAFNISQCFATELSVQLPGLGLMQSGTTIDCVTTWVDAQSDELANLKASERSKIQPRAADGVYVFCDNDEFGRILVPSDKRRLLVTTCHERMCHLGETKVYKHLKEWYYWPTMQADVRKFLKTCYTCQVAKGYQLSAHKLWRATPYSAPRAQWGFDLKGIQAADTGHDNVGVYVDMVTHRLVLFAAIGRSAPTLTQKTIDHLCSRFGPPLAIRTDHAQELVGRVFTDFWRMYGTNQTSTFGYHATGNALAERCMRFLNCCLRQLSDKQYRQWPIYLSSFEFAWNHSVQDRLGCSPFEADTGLPARTPEIINSLPLIPPPLDIAAGSIVAVQRSARCWAHQAALNTAYFKRLRTEQLNAKGSRRTFSVGDKVLVYKPPSADEARARARLKKHIQWYTDPCTVTEVKRSVDGDPVGYVVRNANGRVFKRSAMNVRPFYEANDTDAPSSTPSTQDSQDIPLAQSPTSATLTPPPKSTRGFKPGDFFIAVDDPRKCLWWLHRVLSVSDTEIVTHIYGTRSAIHTSAVFQPVYVTRANTLTTRVPRSSSASTTKPWRQTFLPHHLPTDVKVRGVTLTSSGKFTTDTKRVLRSLPGTHTHAVLKSDMRSQLMTSTFDIKLPEPWYSAPHVVHTSLYPDYVTSPRGYRSIVTCAA